MRTAALLGTLILLALAGCAAPAVPGESPSAADAGAGSTPSERAGTDAATRAADPPPDPEADALGWEGGYWHNATLSVDSDDGLNDTELAAVVDRAKARVEHVRGLEFDGSVNVTVTRRSNFSSSALRDGSESAALRRFDNAKFEALFLIGGETDSIETQDRSRNASVGGYYDPGEDAMVLISDAATPTLESEQTLAHELVHALQDQHFDLGGGDRAGSRDAYNGRNGLIEGDPTAVHQAYMDRCGAAWSCIEAPAEGGDGAGDGPSSLHLGVYLLEFFPYSDGPTLVEALREDGGWARVNRAYEAPPGSAREVIYPARYGDFEPDTVGLTDDLRAGWQRVTPPGRADHARLGQSALTAMLGYTLYDDYNGSAVVAMDDLLNLGEDGVDATDPIDYDLAPIRGWTGDRLHVYHRDGELAYRWRLTWDSPAAAREFASAYRAVLTHWGGRAVEDGRWSVPADSPFTGAYHVTVRGEAVTVGHAPSPAALADVDPAAR
jgi:hypothetical protein